MLQGRKDSGKYNLSASYALKSSVGLLLKYLQKELATKSLDKTDAIHSAGRAIRILLPARPEAVKELAYKKLNVYPFKDVPLCWRRAFEEACLWLILRSLETVIRDTNDRTTTTSTDGNVTCNKDFLSNVRNSPSLLEWVNGTIQLCDQAIIFAGAPRRRALIDVILEWIELEGPSGSVESVTPDITTSNVNFDSNKPRSRKRRRRSSETVSMPTAFPSAGRLNVPLLHKIRRVERQKSISLFNFEQHVQSSRTPLIVYDVLNHWPALKRWKDPQYWHRKTLGGKRLVPVEIGKSYTDESWGQRIMNFEEFLNGHLLEEMRPETSSEDETCEDYKRSKATGYLAQHDLFAQITSLRNDIAVPDYCYVDTPESNNGTTNSNDSDTKSPPPDPQLNIWLGPANTVSPAHTDPHHNLLAQVFGRKYIRLFAPSETHKMYPISQKHDGDIADAKAETKIDTYGVDMGNTSSVDVGAFIDFKSADSSKYATGRGGDQHGSDLDSLVQEKRAFPMHENAEYLETILEAGECLYIPRGWWHYIRSLETSCNVSFWWD